MPRVSLVAGTPVKPEQRFQWPTPYRFNNIGAGWPINSVGSQCWAQDAGSANTVFLPAGNRIRFGGGDHWAMEMLNGAQTSMNGNVGVMPIITQEAVGAFSSGWQQVEVFRVMTVRWSMGMIGATSPGGAFTGFAMNNDWTGFPWPTGGNAGFGVYGSTGTADSWAWAQWGVGGFPANLREEVDLDGVTDELTTFTMEFISAGRGRDGAMNLFVGETPALSRSWSIGANQLMLYTGGQTFFSPGMRSGGGVGISMALGGVEFSYSKFTIDGVEIQT